MLFSVRYLRHVISPGKSTPSPYDVIPQRVLTSPVDVPGGGGVSLRIWEWLTVFAAPPPAVSAASTVGWLSQRRPVCNMTTTTSDGGATTAAGGGATAAASTPPPPSMAVQRSGSVCRTVSPPQIPLPRAPLLMEVVSRGFIFLNYPYITLSKKKMRNLSKKKKTVMN